MAYLQIPPLPHSACFELSSTTVTRRIRQVWPTPSAGMQPEAEPLPHCPVKDTRGAYPALVWDAVWDTTPSVFPHLPSLPLCQYFKNPGDANIP